MHMQILVFILSMTHAKLIFHASSTILDVVNKVMFAENC